MNMNFDETVDLLTLIENVLRAEEIEYRVGAFVVLKWHLRSYEIPKDVLESISDKIYACRVDTIDSSLVATEMCFAFADALKQGDFRELFRILDKHVSSALTF